MKRLTLVLSLVVFALLGLISSVFAAEQRWSKFSPGSWVLYEISGGMEQKQTLVEKTDTEVTIKNEEIMRGNVVSSQEIKIPLSEHSPMASGNPEVKISSEEFEFQGKKLNCKVYDSETAQGHSKTLFSEEIPGGLVQATLGGQILMTAIDCDLK